jgi:hypothetical protein
MLVKTCKEKLSGVTDRSPSGGGNFETRCNRGDWHHKLLSYTSVSYMNENWETTNSVATLPIATETLHAREVICVLRRHRFPP